MDERPSHPIRSFLIELAIYSLLIIGYVSMVLRFMGDWLKVLFDHSKMEYALVSLALIIGQGVVLEIATSTLLKIISNKTQ